MAGKTPPVAKLATGKKAPRKNRQAPDELNSTELKMLPMVLKNRSRHEIASTINVHPGTVTRAKARISKYLDAHPDMLKAAGKLRKKILDTSLEIMEESPSELNPAQIAIVQQGRQVSDRVQEIAQPVKRVVESTHEERRHVVIDVRYDEPLPRSVTPAPQDVVIEAQEVNNNELENG